LIGAYERVRLGEPRRVNNWTAPSATPGLHCSIQLRCRLHSPLSREQAAACLYAANESTNVTSPYLRGGWCWLSGCLAIHRACALPCSERARKTILSLQPPDHPQRKPSKNAVDWLRGRAGHCALTLVRSALAWLLRALQSKNLKAYRAPIDLCDFEPCTTCSRPPPQRFVRSVSCDVRPALPLCRATLSTLS